MIPSKVFLTRGLGVHRNKLESFELALRDAGIEKYNLVYVSSILPPNCQVIGRDEGLQQLRPGEIVYAVLSRNETDEPRHLIGACVAMARPQEESHYGYISEHHDFGLEEQELKDLAEDMAASMLASTLGVEFDPDKSYDERKEIYQMSAKIVATQSMAQTAYGYHDKDGRRKSTSVVAAAIFIP